MRNCCRATPPRCGSSIAIFRWRNTPGPARPQSRRASLKRAQPGLGLAYRKYSHGESARDHGRQFQRSAVAIRQGSRQWIRRRPLPLSNDARLAALVEEDYQDGVARGIAHTPTVLVNGRPFVETFPVEDVAKAIDAELAAAK